MLKCEIVDRLERIAEELYLLRGTVWGCESETQYEMLKDICNEIYDITLGVKIDMQNEKKS